MNFKEFEKAIGLVEGLTSPETKITDAKLSSKILKLKRWYMPLLEEYNAGASAISLKWIAPKTFGVNHLGGYLSGNKADYDQYQKETIEFLNTNIDDRGIEFTEAELEGCTINLSIISQMDDLGILK